MYAYNPATGELISDAVIADWMGTTKKKPPSFDPQAESCFWGGSAWEIRQAEPPKQEIPRSVSIRQAQRALLDAGYLDAVETAMSSQPREAQIDWAKATEVERQSPLVEAMATILELTEDQLDELFIEASKL